MGFSEAHPSLVTLKVSGPQVHLARSPPWSTMGITGLGHMCSHRSACPVSPTRMPPSSPPLQMGSEVQFRTLGILTHG